jgi:hypothetical protein
VGVGLVVSGPGIPVVAGSEATGSVAVWNDSGTVQAFRLELLGIDEPFARIEPAEVRLFPGERANAVIEFRPPRSSDVIAGRHHFAVRAVAIDDDSMSTVEEADIDIEPFSAVSLELRPKTARGSTHAIVRMAVTNTGNARERYELSAADEDDRIGVDIKPNVVVLDPGDTVVTKLRLRAVGGASRGDRLPYTAFAAAPGLGQPVSVAGALLIRRTVGPWVVRGVAAGVVLLAATAIFLGTRGGGPQSEALTADDTTTTTAPALPGTDAPATSAPNASDPATTAPPPPSAPPPTDPSGNPATTPPTAPPPSDPPRATLPPATIPPATPPPATNQTGNPPTTPPTNTTQPPPPPTTTRTTAPSPTTTLMPPPPVTAAPLWAKVTKNGDFWFGSHALGSFGTGAYEIQFDRDVSMCAFTASASGDDFGGPFAYVPALVVTGAGQQSPNYVTVMTKNRAGEQTNASFNLMVTCPGTAAAFAVVDAKGALARGNVVTATAKLATGKYRLAVPFDASACTTVVTVGSAGQTAATLAGLSRVAGVAGSGPGFVDVNVRDLAGKLADGPFHAVVRCGTAAPNAEFNNGSVGINSGVATDASDRISVGGAQIASSCVIVGSPRDDKAGAYVTVELMQAQNLAQVFSLVPNNDAPVDRTLDVHVSC